MNLISCCCYCSFTNERALIVNVDEKSIAAEDVRKVYNYLTLLEFNEVDDFTT